LKERYGNPDNVTEMFLSPYYKGDGYEEQAISSRKGFLRTRWDFNNKCYILLSIPNSLDTFLAYTNEELYDMMEAEENKKNLGDL
jgi:hypothetical protein